MSDLMQAPPGHELTPTGPEKASGGRNRLIALVGVLAGVVVLGLAAFFLFFAGGEEEDLGPVPSAQPPAATDGKGDKADGGEDTIPPVFQDTVGRDPFEPLAAEAVEVVPEPQPTEPPATDGGGNPPALAPDFYQATLHGVDGKTATVVVNGVAYDVQVGDRFPSVETGPFQLTKIAADGKSVYLKWGSESVHLTSKTGFIGQLG